MKLNKQKLQQLEEASRIGKFVEFVYPESGKSTRGEVVDEVYAISNTYKFILQQIKSDEEYDDGSKYAYRFGYYVWSHKANSVRWAQRPLLVSSKECQDLFAKARAKGWDMFDQ